MNQELLYSQEVLEGTPERVTKFLQGVGALPIVRTLLAQNGMTDDDIKEGRALLLKCLAEPADPRPDVHTESASAQRAAVAELDQWDEPNFARFGATLRRHDRSAHDYVFHDLKPAAGPLAVQGIATFLARIDALETGADPARRASKKADAAAAKLLESRGLTAAERKRLKKLVDVALGPTSVLDELPKVDTSARLLSLNELRGWFDEWSTTARAVVKKRSDRIRLGLAVRKSSTNAGGDVVDGAASDTATD
ncbi:hypothetical protein AKJ09_07622 [Labilithrix luteola]|uniref:Uncharacterized protein n=1 Tax=Labilithrix luteola TaxID=1391654 RepID=A0A0K1Q5G2_9BACT|nr:hypothetical protein [Labilithrix luteola]AKV00959.1 hypothetical protein AKJ09_07622 [Labilithrix luteola]